MNIKKQFRDGLLTQNPVLVQLLGMCSTMAITTTLFNGLGMGVCVTIILICSNVVISLLRKVIPSKIRIAAYIVVIAGFVTMAKLKQNSAPLSIKGSGALSCFRFLTENHIRYAEVL